MTSLPLAKFNAPGLKGIGSAGEMLVARRNGIKAASIADE
jgi:hypothetical protein